MPLQAVLHTSAVRGLFAGAAERWEGSSEQTKLAVVAVASAAGGAAAAYAAARLFCRRQGDPGAQTGAAGTAAAGQAGPVQDDTWLKRRRKASEALDVEPYFSSREASFRDGTFVSAVSFVQQHEERGMSDHRTLRPRRVARRQPVPAASRARASSALSRGEPPDRPTSEPLRTPLERFHCAFPVSRTPTFASYHPAAGSSQPSSLLMRPPPLTLDCLLNDTGG